MKYNELYLPSSSTRALQTTVDCTVGSKTKVRKRYRPTFLPSTGLRSSGIEGNGLFGIGARL